MSNGASLSTTTITDSAIVIGSGWNYTAAGAVAYLAVNGGYYSGSGDASQARLRLYSSGNNIIGFGLSSGGVEYFSGGLKKHVFWGDIVGNGKFYQKDTIYFGPNATYDGIGANYLSLGRKLGGPMSNPTRIELNGSYSDELNKPTKAKIWLFGDTDASIIGFGITASSGMEIFTGTPGLATFHGLAKYDVNRASQFNARTLVDKGYVDSVKSATMKQWTGLNSDTANIFHNGNVGIGVAAAPNAADRLVVNGNIRARRVIVTLQGWGDYVFDSAYNLRPLNQVADYVKQYKHLPDMPPATTLEKDGADMGEVLKQQQVKIEELTLYIIEQNKKQQALQLQLDEQMKMIRDLQKDKSDPKTGK